MKERPILMSAPMVKATLADRKLQTRRILNQLLRFGMITEFGKSDTPGYDWTFRDKRMCWNDLDTPKLLEYCPYGRPGDRLWVRETFVIEGTDEYPMEESQYPRDGRPVDPGDADSYGWKVPWYRATDGEPNIVNEDAMDNGDEPERTRWKPSIFMPRWASRITLEIDDVRVQRLNEISTDDAAREGVSLMTPPFPATPGPTEINIRNNFKLLWDSINGERPGAAWADNPWVWAVTFRRVK